MILATQRPGGAKEGWWECSAALGSYSRVGARVPQLACPGHASLLQGNKRGRRKGDSDVEWSTQERNEREKAHVPDFIWKFV